MAKREQGQVIASWGFTGVTKYKKFYVISHGGNMGDRLRDVAANFDRLMGKGAFAFMKQNGESDGSPDYSYWLKVPAAHYESWVRK